MTPRKWIERLDLPFSLNDILQIEAALNFTDDRDEECDFVSYHFNASNDGLQVLMPFQWVLQILTNAFRVRKGLELIMGYFFFL